MRKKDWKEISLKLLSLCLLSGALAGCQPAADIQKTENMTSDTAREVSVSEKPEDSGEKEADEKLWDGFSHGIAKKDGYSYSNSTNTYRNDPEDGYGLVYQSILGSQEEKTITLRKEDAEMLSVSYVTDEAIYYHCCFDYDIDKEQYTREELWQVPVEKTEGLDKLLFDKEKRLFELNGLSGIYVMDSLIYVNCESRQADQSFRIFDAESKKWLQWKEIPGELEKMDVCYWCGATEEGGFLCAIRYQSDDDEPHLEESVYLFERKGQSIQKIAEGKKDEKFSAVYDSKAFFLSNGHSVQLYQSGKLTDYLSEKVIDEKVKAVWERWTEESSAWDYRNDRWYLYEIRLSEQGSLELIFYITDSQKEITDYDWIYKVYNNDEIFFSKAIALKCPLLLEPSSDLEEAGDANGLLESFEVLFDRMNWQDYQKSLKSEEAEAFLGYLPVLTQEESFELYEWDGKKEKIKDCPCSAVTMKKWMEKEKLENRLYLLTMQDIFQDGTPELLLEFKNQYILILHQENGKIYGFHSKRIEDQAINKKGILYIEHRTDDIVEDLYYQIQYPKKRKQNELSIKDARLKKVAVGSGYGNYYYIGKKKVSEKKLERFWGEAIGWSMPTWR